ncbi:MAG: M48 family metalloprotease [Candidatus Heimdallarchaeota archaeon]|nr:M48 family metalloprotease [Candidatus Heimdallarchaeota archaeon]
MPNMLSSVMAKSIYILTTMYGAFFALISGAFYIIYNESNILIAGMAVSPVIFGLLITAILVLLQFMIGPFFMDFQLRWMYHMTWISIDQLPGDMAHTLHQSMQKYNWRVGKIGVIHDGTPNAFTYGWKRNGARIVVTEGLMDMLEPEERVGVLQHEIGHIINRDFAFMTLAQFIPILFYTLYSQSSNFAEVISKARRGSSKSSKNDPTPALIAGLYTIAVTSWLIYAISSYIVAYLSRLRETAADFFSATETQNPNALSSALVKIAYGMVIADARIKQQLSDDNIGRKQRTDLNRRQSMMYGYRAMGISDIKSARGLVMSAYAGGTQEVREEHVAAAASWDLTTPWAKYLELYSTHPLTGKRLKNLDKIAPELNQDPKYPSLGTVKPPESLWDEFITDLLLMNVVPALLFILPLVLGILAVVFNFSLYLGVGIGLLLASGLWMLRTKIQYPVIDAYDDLNRPKNTVLEALTSMEKDGYYEASPFRGKPIVLEGIVTGRGNPGFFLGDDFVIQDETGFVRVDYQSVFSLYGLWFGYRHVRDMMGTKVKLIGWYRRGMAPMVSMYKLYRPNGKVHKNRWRGANRILGFFIGILGVLSILYAYL